MKKEISTAENPEIIVQNIIFLNREIDNPKTVEKKRKKLLKKRSKLIRQHTFLTTGFWPIGAN